MGSGAIISIILYSDQYKVTDIQLAKILIGGNANMASEESEADQYLEEKSIKPLFQSLTVGLLFHRPADPVGYLLECLDRLKRDSQAQRDVFWDTFLPAANRPSFEISDSVLQSSSSIAPKVPIIIGAEHDKEKERIEGAVHSRQNAQNATSHKAIEPSIIRETETLRPASPVDDDGSEPDVDGSPDDAIHGTSISTSDTHQIISDPKVLAIIRGSLDDLPAMPRNTVRIFISSTFSDFKAERNVLHRKAYSPLQEFCRQLGLDFQVVDMRWGVTDELQNDHLVSELCLREITTCQQISFGPNFVALLGNRYGFRPFPSLIDEEEFEVLTKVVKMDDIPGLSTLTEWYKKDDNTIPSKYTLQPIDTKLEFYNDLAAENTEKRQIDIKRWQEISSTLQGILRKAAMVATKKQLLDKETISKYLISVTESEIESGLLTADDAPSRVLCYKRNLSGLLENLNNPMSVKFIDQEAPGKADVDAQELLEELSSVKVPTKLSKDEVRSYSVNWEGTPLEESTSEDHLKYLHNFADDFVDDMQNLIRLKLEDVMEEAFFTRDLYQEVLHHGRFAKVKASLFCGREESVGKIKKYFSLEDEGKCPFVVGGQSGQGKTALLAHIATCISQWETTDQVVVVRFFGTSPQSSNILSVLKSLVFQVCYSYVYTPPSDDLLVKIGQVRRYLWSLLQRVSDLCPERKLFVILDSVDQLSQKQGAHSMSWLPRQLPKNVYIVLSMLSDRYDCLPNVKERLGDQEHIIELPPLSVTSGESIVDNYLTLKRKCLTESQHKLVMDTFAKSRQPLFLKLLMDIALKWHSYTSVDALSLPSSIQEVIEHLFLTLETKFGPVFVHRALGYLSGAQGGLTSLEMEDVLSCDDEVLNAVYKYHDPPFEDGIRIPPLMWARLEDELREYLAERLVDGKTVLVWYHRQFWEAAESRYLSGETTVIDRHQQLAEIFDQEAGIYRSITLTQRKGKVLTDANRKVSPQPLDTMNIRKLNCLPKLLFVAKNNKRLVERCLLNFDWVFTKIRAVGISDVFAEYETFADCDEFKAQAEVRLFCQFLEICYDALKGDPMLFPVHVLERLEPYAAKMAAIATMVEDARRWIDTTTNPLLLPVHPLKLMGLDSPLRFSLLAGSSCRLTPDKQFVICGFEESNTGVFKLNVVKIASKEVIAWLALRKESPCTSSIDSKVFYYMNNNQLICAELETGDRLHEVDYIPDEFEKYTPRCIAASADGRYIALGSRTGQPKLAEKNGNWRMESVIALFSTKDLQSSLSVIKLKGRRHIDNLVFTADDNAIVSTCKNRLQKYSLPDLQVISSHSIGDALHGSIAYHVMGKTTMAFGMTSSKGARVLLYNYAKEGLQFLPTHDKEESADRSEPFAVQCKLDMSSVLLATSIVTKTKRASKIWLWNFASQEDDTESASAKTPVLPDYISVGENRWKHATSLCADEQLSTAFIGWSNGEIGLIDLLDKKELLNIKAHGHAVNGIDTVQDGDCLLTTGKDQSLKVWDLPSLRANTSQTGIESSWEETQASESVDTAAIPGEPEGKGEDTNVIIELSDDRELTPDEQIVHLTSVDKYVITAGHLNCEGPHLWHMKSGKLDANLSKEYEVMYQSAYDAKQEFDSETSRMHATVYKEGNYLIYARQRRNMMTLFITEDLEKPTFVAYDHFKTPACYFHVICPPCVSGPAPGKGLIILVREGVLELRDFQLDLISSISIPPISEVIGNIESSAAKRKLLLYRVFVTLDMKYLGIASTWGIKGLNGDGRSTKYIDIVDLETSKYIKRLFLLRHTNIHITLDSFYYFNLNDDDKESGLFGPTRLPSLKEGDYSCLIQAPVKMISEDRKFGFEFARHHHVRIWRFDPLEKLHTLKGHTADITSSRFSKDNNLAVTTSADTTLRVWSVVTGEQFCMFCLYGTMVDAEITPSAEYVVAHCYSGPQRKRAAILKLHQIPNRGEEVKMTSLIDR